MFSFPYQRILILGNCGAGKSTLASALTQRTGLPIIHLDQHYWRPGWVEPGKDIWRAQVQELVQQAQWIMDGNYSGTWDLRLPAADLVIYLDYGRYLVTFRMLSRYLRYRGRTRPDMGPGCPERWDADFFRYVWHYRTRKRPAHLRRLQLEVGQNLLVFREPRAVNRWLGGIGLSVF